jgi:hypothetical protein
MRLFVFRKPTPMRIIVLRIPLLSGVAAAMLVAAPAFAADAPIQFVPGTGEAQGEPAAYPAAPLAEAPRSDTQADLMHMSDRLAAPRLQDGVGDMVEAMGEHMLDLPIGKFAAAVERSIPREYRGRGRDRSHINERDTLADMVGRDADQLPHELAKGSQQMMGMLSGFAAAFAGMIPEFEDMARDMDAKMADIKRDRRTRDPRN